RQVEAMLLEAAARTDGVLRDPAPFVLLLALADFAVTYELNVFTEDPTTMLPQYTRIHRNVLDVFNEHGVQIMTPAYEGDPPEPKVVPRERWFEAPARPPQPTR
ncbi:MAG TPA: mechanosensitive ion channel family protein, partial [Myxococcota bacterium]